jgi:hypothetical protein
LLKGAVVDFHDRHSNPGFEKNARLTRSLRRRPSRNLLLFLQRPPPVKEVLALYQPTATPAELHLVDSVVQVRQPYLVDHPLFMPFARPHRVFAFARDIEQVGLHLRIRMRDVPVVPRPQQTNPDLHVSVLVPEATSATTSVCTHVPCGHLGSLWL